MDALLDKMKIDKIEDQAHVIRVIDPSGDLKFTWDTENKDEVETIETMFNKKKKDGWIAYAVKRDGTKGRVITKFDPDAEKIILAPPMAGG